MNLRKFRSKYWWTKPFSQKCQITRGGTLVETSLAAKRRASSSTAVGERSASNHIARIVAPARHTAVKKWVVFSDLHVKSSSIETCEEVLDKVHTEAVRLSEGGNLETGIIFLGDFWHTRGALSVELLNRVLRSLKKWDKPVVMIPGNHDQVSLGGQIHALEPLVYAFNGREEQILLISEPTICLGALWLPYRRDHTLLQDALVSAAPDMERGEVSIIFCHADVRGAKMNDNIISRSGADLQMFPSGIPVYSGHFHKPHTLVSASRRLTYVGSPYQTSLSEAHQQKYLYCLPMKVSYKAEVESSIFDGEGDENTKLASPQFTWCCPCHLLDSPEGERTSPAIMDGEWKVKHMEERVPLSIGRRYHRVVGLDDPLLHDQDEVRTGDKVVISVSSGTIHRPEQQSILTGLRNRGVEFELRHERLDSDMRLARALKASTVLQRDDLSSGVNVNIPLLLDSESRKPANQTLESLNTTGKTSSEITDMFGDIDVSLRNPITLFEEYLSAQAATVHVNFNGDNESVTDGHMLSKLDQLRSTGLEIISNHTSDSPLLSSLPQSSSDGHREVCFEQVQLKNFGPFGDDSVINYPLKGRGLVLLRGITSLSTPTAAADDGVHAGRTGESNGVGKTSLVMSILWALSGSLDGRVVSDGRAADVAYDGAIGGGVSAKKSRKSKGDVSMPSTTAEVTVQGTINGEHFAVTRRRGSKRSALKFVVGGRNLTGQTQRDTQALIDSHLGVGSNLLQRACFFGQHSTAGGALLGLTDARLKAELAPLVQHSSLWVKAAASCRQREREIRKEITDFEVELRIRSEELDDVKKQVQEAEFAVIERKKEKELAIEGFAKDERLFSMELGLLDIDTDTDAEIPASANSSNADQTPQNSENIVSPLPEIWMDANYVQNRSRTEKMAVRSLMESLHAQSTLLHEQSIAKVRRRGEIMGQLNQDLASLRERNTSLQDVLVSALSEEKSCEAKRTLYLNKTAEHEAAIGALIKTYHSLTALQPSLPALLLQSSRGENSSINSSSTELDLSELRLASMSGGDLGELITSVQWPIPPLQAGLRELQAALATIEAQVAQTEASLQGLRAVENMQHGEAGNFNAPHKQRRAEAIVYESDGHGKCGTCGQTLTPALLDARTTDLTTTLQSLTNHREDLLRQEDTWTHASETVDALNKEYDRLCVLHERIEEENVALRDIRCRVEAVEQESASVTSKLNFTMLQNNDMKRESELEEIQQKQQRDQISVDMASMEMKLRELDEKESILLEKLDAFQGRKLSNQAALNHLNDSVEEAQVAVMRVNDEKKRLDKLISTLEVRMSKANKEHAIVDTLSTLFGTRGIQNYCFGESLQQLELLANLFLMALSEGELQLVLRSPMNTAENNEHWLDSMRSIEIGTSEADIEEERKIIRYVLARDARASDGSASLCSDADVMSLYKRRALSQLSGGQFKRVQLALDLAYAECVRRRGLIRSNLMVLDEILTHLDANGRDAVGAVLRNMVHASSSPLDTNGVSLCDVQRQEDPLGNENTFLNVLSPLAYDTVILILQDFAAAEMRESFDHIDIVTKCGSTSRVTLDGGMP